MATRLTLRSFNAKIAKSAMFQNVKETDNLVQNNVSYDKPHICTTGWTTIVMMKKKSYIMNKQTNKQTTHPTNKQTNKQTKTKQNNNNKTNYLEGISLHDASRLTHDTTLNCWSGNNRTVLWSIFSPSVLNSQVWTLWHISDMWPVFLLLCNWKTKYFKVLDYNKICFLIFKQLSNMFHFSMPSGYVVKLSSEQSSDFVRTSVAKSGTSQEGEQKLPA